MITNLRMELFKALNCRQGGPDWDEGEEGDPAPVELMLMMREAEESSLYFTPAGTPLQEVPGQGHHDLTSPGPGAGGGARRKSHRRMVSNLSNLKGLCFHFRTTTFFNFQ